MDFDVLTTFLEVAKQGNFSRAGQKVFRSQSAVSAQLHQLEEEYGEKLLDRAGKTVHLTPAGKVLLDYARQMLTLRDESLRAVADQNVTPRGILAVGANEATCLYALPDVFGEYARRYPLVQINIYRNFSRKIVERIESGALDVGVVTLPVRSPNLKVHSIFRDRIMVMVNPRHPLARHAAVSVEEIAQHPLIFPKSGFTRQLLDKLFRPYHEQLRVTMELPSVGMIKNFVAAGLGATLISSAFVQAEAAARQVTLIPLKGVELRRELGLIYRKDRSLPRAAQAFIALVRQRTAAAAHAG